MLSAQLVVPVVTVARRIIGGGYCIILCTWQRATRSSELAAVSVIIFVVQPCAYWSVVGQHR